MPHKVAERRKMNGYGKILIELRGNKSQQELATVLGVSVSAIGMYEREERVPRDEIKRKIAAYFGKTVQEIFYN